LFDFKTAEEAFKKEQELVPLSETNQYNEMCYNISKGGIGGEMPDIDRTEMN